MQPILTVDLTEKKLGKWIIPSDWERDYLGAASLAPRLLFEYLLPDLAPLSPEAPLLFLTGPLTGTAGPSVGRFVVCARSPATGLIRAPAPRRPSIGTWATSARSVACWRTSRAR